MDVSKRKYDAKIKVNDFFLITLWDKDYFNEGKNRPGVTGNRVAEGLFSIEAFSTNTQAKFRLSYALANQVLPVLIQGMEETEKEMRTTLEDVKRELNDPILQAIDVPVIQEHEYTFTIERGKGTPLVNRFIRLFVIMNEITNALKTLHFKGVIPKSDYKKRENAAAKPLRKLMNDTNIIIKNYHKKRKEMGG